MVLLAQRLLLLAVCTRLLHNLLAHGRPGRSLAANNSLAVPNLDS